MKKVSENTSGPFNNGRYQSPGAVGGVLIRQCVGFFRNEGLLQKGQTFHQLFIATSGGSDSVALATLIARYGRKIVDPKQITLIHVNHGWRGEESNRDSRFVLALSKKLGVKCIRVRGKKLPHKGESWEDSGRKLRKRIFRQIMKRTFLQSNAFSKENPSLHHPPQMSVSERVSDQLEKETLSPRSNALCILTAHTKDDLFETKLWRFFTGAFAELGDGILPVLPQVFLKRDASGKNNLKYSEIRPLLGCSKAMLQEFLREEKMKFVEDSSNADPKFLRNKMRKELIPVLKTIFPGVVDSVCKTKKSDFFVKKC